MFTFKIVWYQSPKKVIVAVFAVSSDIELLMEDLGQTKEEFDEFIKLD